MDANYAAPFAYTGDCSIKNLRTVGMIYTSGRYAGGIVGGDWGTNWTRITNCRSSVEIHSSTVGDGRHGGIIGWGENDTEITNSVFAPQAGSSIGGGTFYYTGNGGVELDDVIILLQYLANYDDETGTSLVDVGDGADADGNGDVELDDVILLLQYLANYDDETGESTVVLGPPLS